MMDFREMQRALRAMRAPDLHPFFDLNQRTMNDDDEDDADADRFEPLESYQQRQKERTEQNKLRAQSALDRLSAMPGMKSIKEQVDQMISFADVAKKREAMGLKCEKQSLHMIFAGNPGTGKTTAARLIGEAYVALGLVKGDANGEVPFVEVHHADVESGMVGKAEANMSKKFEEARGGVLFMDEAYAFVGPHHYHKTFIANIVQKIEDMRDEVLVIAAGYPDEMQEFLNSNPGLRSRFSNVIDFSDYETSELIQIAEMMCQERDYEMTDDFKRQLTVRLDKERKLQGFGNARTVRNIIEQSIRKQSLRVAKYEEPNKEALMFLISADLDTAVRTPVEPKRKQSFGQVIGVTAVAVGKDSSSKAN